MDDLLKLDRALTPQERRQLFHTAPKKNAGYAAAPGTGPVGETCKTCRHKTAQGGTAGRYLKCELTPYTRGPATDIKAGSPACSMWQPRTVRE